MLVVAKDDRKLRIEVGYGLEGALTDVTSKRIIDEEITPKFRTGDFAGGISAGVDRMMRVIDGEPLPAPEPQMRRREQFVNHIDPSLPYSAVRFGVILREVFGGFGSASAGGSSACVGWFISGSFAAAASGALHGFHDGAGCGDFSGR